MAERNTGKKTTYRRIRGEFLKDNGLDESRTVFKADEIF